MSGIERGVIGALGAVVVLSVAATVFRMDSDPVGRFLSPGNLENWIEAEEPITAEIRQWRRVEVPVARFKTVKEAYLTGNPAGIVKSEAH